MKRLTILSTIALIVMIVDVSHGEDPVHFADARVKAAVEATLGKNDPTPTDMLGLASLYVPWSSCKCITNLTGLEYATNMTALDIHYNVIADISPLAGLAALTYLDLRDNRISYLRPLTGLINLTYLDLSINKITDISSLYEMTNLTILSVNANQLNQDAYCNGLQTIKNSSPGVALFFDAPNLNPPGGVSASNGTYMDKVLISYEALCPGPGRTDTFQYMVYRSASYDGVKEAISSWLGGTSFDDTMASPGIHYYYWVKSDYSSNFSDADEGWRWTIPVLQRPTVVTLSATNVGRTSATLNARIEYDGSEACQCRFSWWSSGSSASCGMGGDLTTGQSYQLDIDGLKPGTLYHFQAFARNSAGESEGNVETFETLPLQCTLTISSNRGGCVVEPGEGEFVYEADTNVTVQASADHNFQFIKWNGSAVDAEKVTDPNAPTTQVTVDAGYTLRAIFATQLDILYVDDNAPADPCWYNPRISDPNEDGGPNHPFDEIREAIDVSLDGVTIVVRPGTYYETIDFTGKAITITGFEPNLPRVVYDTVIDANGLGTVVTFNEREDSNSVLSGLVITGGKGSQAGGIYCYYSSPTISNCLIVGNRVTTDTGAAVYCVDSNTVLANCTLSGNYGGPSGSGLCFEDCNIVLVNSILWGDSPCQIDVRSGRDPNITYSDMTGGWFGIGNLDVDPCFAVIGYWVDPNDSNLPLDPSDPNAVWLDGDYHLKSPAGRWDPNSRSWAIDAVTSLCIDAGNPNSDWTAELWPHGKRMNMGAFGGTAEASMSLSPVGNIADLTNDGVIDFRDLARFGNWWAVELALLAEDIDRNGRVDFSDLAIFASHWLWTGE